MRNSTAARFPHTQNIWYLQVFKECDWRRFRQRWRHEEGCKKCLRGAFTGQLCLELCLWDDLSSCMCYWRVSVWEKWNPRLCKDNVLQDTGAKIQESYFRKQKTESAFNLFYSSGFLDMPEVLQSQTPIIKPEDFWINSTVCGFWEKTPNQPYSQIQAHSS